MIKLRWLAELAKQNPLIFSIVLLIIAIGFMAKVIVNRDQKIDQCNNNNAILRGYYMAKSDSMDAHCNSRILELTNRIEESLVSRMNDYRQQLEVQKNLNRIVDSTLNRNKTILNKNRDKIKNLGDD